MSHSLSLTKCQFSSNKGMIQYSLCKLKVALYQKLIAVKRKISIIHLKMCQKAISMDILQTLLIKNLSSYLAGATIAQLLTQLIVKLKVL